jgi:hypothetical protein
MYSPLSLAVRGAAHFAALADKVLPRIHRKLDARFQLMDEALAVLEARPVTSFPTIHKSSARLLSAGSGATFTTTLTGLNLGEDVVATLGGVPLTVGAHSATSIALSVPKASLGLVVDSLLILDVSVGGVRCAPIDMIVVA